MLLFIIIMFTVINHHVVAAAEQSWYNYKIEYLPSVIHYDKNIFFLYFIIVYRVYFTFID